LGDNRVAAGTATSKDSSAPGLTISSQNASGAIGAASLARVTRTVSVQAVYSWMFDVPAIVTRAVSMARGAACAAGPLPSAAAVKPADVVAASRNVAAGKMRRSA
jgi:hypothetical protein